jgi:methylenetetrahydrofolate--tRNA-(uracil-5-)-methyltransferase
MNVNFGLFPSLDGKGRPVRGGERKRALSSRALADLAEWLNGPQPIGTSAPGVAAE